MEAHANTCKIIPRSEYTGRVGPNLFNPATASIICSRETASLEYLLYSNCTSHTRCHALSHHDTGAGLGNRTASTEQQEMAILPRYTHIS